MKITDFKVGDKVKNKLYSEDTFFEIGKDNFYDESDIVVFNPTILLSDDWYKCEEKRKPETWYRFEWKVRGQDPVSNQCWFKCKDSFNNTYFCGNEEFDIEPRVYEEREF